VGRPDKVLDYRFHLPALLGGIKILSSGVWFCYNVTKKKFIFFYFQGCPPGKWGKSEDFLENPFTRYLYKARMGRLEGGLA
jgi:hypothetical protein